MPHVKKLFILGFLIFTFTGVSFSYYESSMYCNMSSKNIKVSLKKEDGSKCKEYTKYIEQKMKTIYKDVLTIQGYIQKKQDAGYRKPIKDTKVQQINDLQKLRLDILASMKVFEKSLLQKSKDLFLAETKPYKTKLLANLQKLQTLLSGSALESINKQIQLMNDALNTIKNIEIATNFITLNNEFRKYVYLKKLIEGK